MRPNEQMCTKRNYMFIKKAWLPKILVIWIIIVALIGRVIYNTMDADDKERRKEVLESMCDQRARMLQDQFSASINHVHALAVLVSTFHYSKTPSTVDQKTFAQYTARTAFERPLLSGVAYAQRVLNSERKEFERIHGWTIMTMDKKPSPIRDEYAPVVFSQETISYIESLDMMSGEEDRENILRSRATGKSVLTSPFRLLGSHHLGVVLTFPVYKFNLSPDPTAEERIRATAGYLGGAFDVETLVENLLGKLAEYQEIAVNVYDVTNSSEPLIMYGRQREDGDLLLKHVSPLDFGDPYRKHHMICRYLQNAPTSWTAITTAFLFSVIGLLVGYMVYSALIHIVKVEDDFHKMQQLKVRAEAADVAKSQFLATVSHEIRTPMNGILGMLAMILDTDLSSTQKDYAQTAQACGKSLVTLINEVLDRAKIEAGKLQLEAVPFEIRSMLDDVISLFSEKARHKGVELALLVSDKVPCIVIGDPGRFRQVITNLVDNSVKFSERGHIFVHVRLAKHAKVVLDKKAETSSNDRSEGVVASGDCQFDTLSGCEAADDRNCWENLEHLTANEEHQCNASQRATLLVCVEDTGIGIPLHAQEQLYMPFMQADSSTSRNYGGTGIGLSISKCLVELMGGQIGFVSRPQIGSTFSFTSVFKMCEKNEVGHLKKSLCQDLPMTFEGLKAVLVDERPLRAAVTKYHLMRLGVVVEVVSSIGMVVDISRKNGSFRSRNGRRPDMVLVDKDTWLSSEDSDSKLKGHTFKLPKMILIATKITSGELEKAKAEGFADRVIMKPLRASMIAACLQQVLGMRKEEQQDMVCGPGLFRGLLYGKKILVVDDNRVNRVVAAGALKKFGANVLCAESGKAAIALFQFPHNFDACFMDIQMPEMDGFETTRRIRKLEIEANEQVIEESSSEGTSNKVERHLPILAMTADVIHATRDECLKCGMDGYVSKPFEEEDLYQAVTKFFEPKTTTDQ
ncbi:hypothetical protein LguiB_025291 [Lonicera macranthoides]